MGLIRRKKKKPWRARNHVAHVEANQLTPDDVDDFMTAADARPYTMLFRAMDALCDELALTHPLKVAKFRVSLQWLRHEARRRNLPWG